MSIRLSLMEGRQSVAIALRLHGSGILVKSILGPSHSRSSFWPESAECSCVPDHGRMAGRGGEDEGPYRSRSLAYNSSARGARFRASDSL